MSTRLSEYLLTTLDYTLLYTVLAKPLTIILFPNTVEHMLNMSRDQKIVPSDDFNPLQCKIEV